MAVEDTSRRISPKRSLNDGSGPVLVYSKKHPMKAAEYKVLVLLARITRAGTKTTGLKYLMATLDKQDLSPEAMKLAAKVLAGSRPPRGPDGAALRMVYSAAKERP